MRSMDAREHLYQTSLSIYRTFCRHSDGSSVPKCCGLCGKDLTTRKRKGAHEISIMQCDKRYHYILCS